MYSRNGLQAQLRILKVDEASYPAVVQALDGRGVPAFVLPRSGVQLWCQQGGPESAPVAPCC